MVDSVVVCSIKYVVRSLVLCSRTVLYSRLAGAHSHIAHCTLRTVDIVHESTRMMHEIH